MSDLLNHIAAQGMIWPCFTLSPSHPVTLSEIIGEGRGRTVQWFLMKEDSKYYPLYHHLQQQAQDEVTLTFAEVETLLGDKLPPTAWGYRAWWSNRGHGSPHAAAWLKAGYRMHHLDLAAHEVTFRKKGLVYHVRQIGDTILWDGELIRALRDQLGLSQIELAEKLGMRQQTISEWENGLYAPKRSTSKFLTLIAKEAGFHYTTE